MQRNCAKCQSLKNLESFPKNKLKHLGRGHTCLECSKQQIKDYYKTRVGIAKAIYLGQVSSSKYRNYPKPSYSSKEFCKWILSQGNFEELYLGWVKSNYHKDSKPSADRIDDYKSYSFDNIRLVTWKENRDNLSKSKFIGKNNKQSRSVVQLTSTGKFIKEFYSIAQASREVNVNTKNIIYCCQEKPKYKTAKGFIWKYKNNYDQATS